MAGYGSEPVGFAPAELFDLETNERVQKALSERQMPKVEFSKVTVDDYSECGS